MFKVLDIDRSGVLNKEEFVRTLKSAVKEAGDQFKNRMRTKLLHLLPPAHQVENGKMVICL